MAKHDFFNSCAPYQPVKHNCSHIFAPYFGLGPLLPKKDSYEVKKMLGHLKIVAQITNKLTISDKYLILRQLYTFEKVYLPVSRFSNKIMTSGLNNA